MTRRPFYASVTRISDLEREPFATRPLPRERWADGDYVMGKVTGSPSALYRVELTTGRMVDLMEGDELVGVLGQRSATLEAVGHWQSVTDDLRLHTLTGAGLLGRATSVAPLMPRLMTLAYQGHALRDVDKVTMADFVLPVAARSFDAPTILLVGTSMSAGKTTAGRVIIRILKAAGLRVVGAKLTGAARYRDVLAFADAGADGVIDFLDAGLPSTVTSPERFREAMVYMLKRIQALDPDVLVAEAGASPLEPYNGDIAVAALAGQLRCTVLSASDPYAVAGVQAAFQLRPDIVTGPAANTSAGVALVAKLTGTPALNLLREAELPRLREILARCLPEFL